MPRSGARRRRRSGAGTACPVCGITPSTPTNTADAAGADESDAVERALSEFDLAGPGLNATDGEAAHPPSPLAAYLVIVAVTLFAAVAPVLLAWRDTSRSPRDKARVTASAAAVAAVIGGAGNYLVEHWEWFSELYAWALTLSPVEALELVERVGRALGELAPASSRR